MSTNINFEATRKIQVLKKGTIENQTDFFRGVWQTPTAVTRAIEDSPDPIQAYKDWVMEGQKDQIENIFAPEDIFSEGPAVGQRTINYGTEHCHQFDAWIKDVTERGYEIKAISW